MTEGNPPLPITASRLAKELGVGKQEMWKTMQELRIYGLRIGSRLSVKQEGALRKHYANVSKADRSFRRPVAAPQQANPTWTRRPDPPIELRTFTRACLCCERRWQFQAETDQPRRYCPDCEGHVHEEAEPPERKVERAEAHVALYKRDRDLAQEHAGDSMRLRDVAFESRRKWQRALAAVMLDHEVALDKVCWCGQPTPCRTWRVLESQNRGIHKEVERWAGLADDDLDEHLSSREQRKWLSFPEDEPLDD